MGINSGFASMFVLALIITLGRAQAFEYETTKFTTAIFNYTYINNNTRYIASKEAVEYYKGKFGALNPDAAYVSSILGYIWTAWAGFSGCDYEGVTEELPRDRAEQDYIVLVKKGGDCSLWDKIQRAAQENFSALIEYHSEKKRSFELLKDYDEDSPNGKSPLVYALAINAAGLFFEELFLNGTKPLLSMSAGQTTIMRIGINRTSVLFVAISFVVLTAISLVWLVFYYIQRFRYIQTRDKTKKRLAAAAKKALALLQVKVLKKGTAEVDVEDNCCSICIEDFQYGDAVRQLPCKHLFHKSCVDPWLLSHHSCPNCKVNVLKALDLVSDLDFRGTLSGEPDQQQGPSASVNNSSTGVNSMADAVGTSGLVVLTISTVATIRPSEVLNAPVESTAVTSATPSPLYPHCPLTQNQENRIGGIELTSHLEDANGNRNDGDENSIADVNVSRIDSSGNNQDTKNNQLDERTDSNTPNQHIEEQGSTSVSSGDLSESLNPEDYSFNEKNSHETSEDDHQEESVEENANQM